MTNFPKPKEPRKPLQRRTPLTSKSELRRAPFPRKQPCVGKTRDREPAPKPRRQKDTGPKKTVRDLVHDRSGNVCERCALAPATDVHHRQARKMGGTSRAEINLPSNLIDLCRPCHASVTNTNGRRPEIELEGLLVREGVRSPAEVPVKLACGWVLLDDEGGYTPVLDVDGAA